MRRAWLFAILIGACGGKRTPAPAPPPPVENHTADEAPPSPPADPGAPRGLLADPRMPACRDYLHAMDAYAHCPKIPQGAQAGLAQSRDAMIQSWGGVDPSVMPDDAAHATNDACQSGADAIRQSMQSVGCPPA